MMASVMCLYFCMHGKKIHEHIIGICHMCTIYFSMYIYNLDILEYTNAKCHFMYTHSQLVDCCVT